jgi:hypothetical protein
MDTTKTKFSEVPSDNKVVNTPQFCCNMWLDNFTLFPELAVDSATKMTLRDSPLIYFCQKVPYGLEFTGKGD